MSNKKARQVSRTFVGYRRDQVITDRPVTDDFNNYNEINNSTLTMIEGSFPDLVWILNELH